MQGITTILLNNMTYISIAIIAAMVLIFLIGVINNLSLKMAYSKIIKELDAINNDGMEVYHNKMLNEIVSSYKEAYLKSYDGVNTQAIIESKFYKLDKGKIGKESFLNNMTPMLLTLGIVGTLYNIIVIVTSLTEMFKGVDAATVPSLASVLGNVSTIIAYLAIAFVTTFIAITLSFIYSVINSITHIEMERTNLFARLEDYLDNILGANLAKAHPRMIGGNNQEGYANTNILYMLENTSNSMIASTSKLEESIVKLSDNLKTMITNNEIQSELEEKKNDIKLEEKIPPLAEKANEQTSKNVDELFKETEEDKAKRLEEEEKNQKAQRLKLLEESRRVLELKANEKLENMKNGDVVPNKDKVYVEEATKEVPKAEEFIKREDIAESLNKSAEIKNEMPPQNNQISMQAPQTNMQMQAMTNEIKLESKESFNSPNSMDLAKNTQSNNYQNVAPVMSATSVSETNKSENNQINDVDKNIGSGMAVNQVANTNPYASTNANIATANTNMNLGMNPASSINDSANNSNSSNVLNSNTNTTQEIREIKSFMPNSTGNNSASNTNMNTNSSVSPSMSMAPNMAPNLNSNYQMSNQNSNLNTANSNYGAYTNTNTNINTNANSSVNPYVSSNNSMQNQTMQAAMPSSLNAANYTANTTYNGNMNNANSGISSNMNSNPYGTNNAGSADESVKPSVNLNELKPVATGTVTTNTNAQSTNETFNMESNASNTNTVSNSTVIASGASNTNMNPNTSAAPVMQEASNATSNIPNAYVSNSAPKSDVIEELKKEQAVRSLTEDDIYKLKQELIRKQEEEKRIQEIMNSKK